MRNPYSRNKDLWGCLLLLILLISLCGCSPSAKSEREIISDLQHNSAFLAENVKIDGYEIIKRQTDKNNNSDLVYITVTINEDELHCTLSYVMQYILYNDGWILENVSQYHDGPWSIEGLSIDQLSSDVTDYDFYFDDYVLEVIDCEILNEGYTYDGEKYEKWFEVALIASNPIFDYRATYEAVYRITDDGWTCQYAIPNFSGYSPAYSPDISATDSIMESLELGNGTSATGYDSYEYVRAETDWENCAETRYYTATKNWWFGTETYLVAIPLNFSLENGEDSALWTYRESTIDSALQSVDWNVEGNWNAGGSSYNVGLSIFNILPTQDSNAFSVLLRCDAYHRDPYWDWDYHCDARDVRATMRQTAPGTYRLDIENPSEDTDNKWQGTFWIWGQDYLDNPCGLYWQWGWKGISSNPNVVCLEMDHDEKEQIEQATKNVISIAKGKGLDVISYDTDNPIYGVWKGIHPTGIPAILCFCPNGTVIYTLALLNSPMDFTYAYDDTILTWWDAKWRLNWETPDFFNMTALDDPDNFWPSFSRIPLR